MPRSCQRRVVFARILCASASKVFAFLCFAFEQARFACFIAQSRFDFAQKRPERCFCFGLMLAIVGIATLQGTASFVFFGLASSGRSRRRVCKARFILNHIWFVKKRTNCTEQSSQATQESRPRFFLGAQNTQTVNAGIESSSLPIGPTVALLSAHNTPAKQCRKRVFQSSSRAHSCSIQCA